MKMLIYGCMSNPTVRLLEQLAALEFGGRPGVQPGMAAATSAILSACQAGDHILCMRDSYRPVQSFMASVGIPGLRWR